MPVAKYEIVREFPHDCKAFTQGLEWYDGALYESTGRVGTSTVRRVKLDNGEVKQETAVPPPYFAEGMTVMGERIYQLTWQHQTGFIYETKSLKKIGEFKYEGQGWGLAHDGKNLILSDGETNRLRFINPQTFAVENILYVKDELGNPLLQMNELEFVNGEIWANIWHQERIARIDPQTGALRGWIDLRGIAEKLSADLQSCAPHDVLNGIAYDDKHKRLFVTGKLWSRVFEIRLKN